MKLIKVEDNYYLLGSDVVKVGDGAGELLANGSWMVLTIHNENDIDVRNQKKIVSSTLDIDGIPKIYTYQLVDLWRDNSVDISDLSFKYGSLYRDHDVKVQDGRQFGFEEGYEQCLSDNIDKKFTLDDMNKCFESARKTEASFDDYLCLINRSEWDVDVEMDGSEIKVTKGYVNIIKIN